MRKSDIHTLATWLSPQYVTLCAKEHGLQIAKDLFEIEDLIEDNDWLAVLGAERAYKEIRGLIRSYITFVKYRDNITSRELELALALRAMGYVGNFQQVLPLPQTEWRKTAIHIWPSTQNIPGVIEIPISGIVPKSEIKYAVLKTISQMMLEIPKLNRAVLKNKVWQRTSGHVLMTVETGTDSIETILVNPSVTSKDKLRKEIFKALRRMKKIEKHELRPIAFQLLREWQTLGFIASPASALISFAEGIETGWGPLCNNGIPLTISVGRKDSHLTLAASVNHQVWDGSFAGECYTYIKTNLPRYLTEKW